MKFSLYERHKESYHHDYMSIENKKTTLTNYVMNDHLVYASIYYKNLSNASSLIDKRVSKSKKRRKKHCGQWREWPRCV